jgi:hypothetical protein
MSSADLLPAARTILGVLGVCLAKPADATGLTLALVLRGLPDDAARWTDLLAAELAQDMARLNLPALIRTMIPQMLAAADPSPAQITTDMAKTCAVMLATLDDPAHKAPKAQEGFTRLVSGLLARHLANPDPGLAPAFATAIAAAQDHLAGQANALADRAQPDAQRLGVTHGLLQTLARRHAPADPANFTSAALNLGAALETAARMQTAADPVTDPIIALVAAEVSRLNAQNLMAEADSTLAAALNLLATQGADASAQTTLHQLALDQARLMAAPDRAAQYILADIARQAHPGGLFRAIHAAWEQSYDRGDKGALTFDLMTALHLARTNLNRSKGIQRTQALGDLGITQFRLGECEAGTRHLSQSLATWRSFLADHPRKTDPHAWAIAKVNIAVALTALAKRTPDPTLLDEAITAFRAALQVQTEGSAPDDHAATSALLTAAEQQLAAQPG